MHEQAGLRCCWMAECRGGNRAWCHLNLKERVAALLPPTRLCPGVTQYIPYMADPDTQVTSRLQTFFYRWEKSRAVSLRFGL